MIGRKTWLVPAIFIAAVLLPSRAAWSSSEERVAWQYVQQVILGQGTVVRWTRPARLYLLGADEQEFRQFQDALGAVNRRLLGAKMQVAGPLFAEPLDGAIDYDHAIVVNLQPESFFVQTPAGRTRIDAPAGNVNFASILVRQRLPPNTKLSVMLHELLHALGLWGHAEGHTVMSAKTDLIGDLTSLSPLDRKALRFLYQYLQPGDGPAEVRRAFDAHWRAIPDS
jgi:hypothetical protein